MVKHMLWCTQNSSRERVHGRATDYYLWDLVSEYYGRRGVGSAVDVRSAEWYYVSELMVACSHRRRLGYSCMGMTTHW